MEVSVTATDPPDEPAMAARASPLTYIWTFLGGIALGLVGGFLQAAEVTIGPASLPVWAVVVLAAMVVTMRAITTSYGSRKPAVTWFLGWLVVSLLLAVTSPAGDQVIADGNVPLFYLFGGVVLGSAFASVPAQLRPPGQQEAAGHTTGRDGGAEGRTDA
jgi:hypothetical protein